MERPAHTKVVESDFEVVVEPKRCIYGIQIVDDDEVKGVCENIKIEILRHVDNIADCYVRWTTEIICDFCGYGFETDEDGPMCCREAQEVWEEEQ